MAMDRKARLKGDEWARIWTYEAERVAREGALFAICHVTINAKLACMCMTQASLCSGAIHFVAYVMDELAGVHDLQRINQQPIALRMLRIGWRAHKDACSGAGPGH